MSKQERIFVVVNPTIEEHVALDRAIITAKLLTPSPTICAFVAIDSDTVDSDVSNDKISRNTDWFEEQIHARSEQLVWNIRLKCPGAITGRKQLCVQLRNLALLAF